MSRHKNHIKHSYYNLFKSLVIITVTALTLVGCTREKTPPNVVLLVIDTLRADMLPVYGENSELAPFISKIGKEGVVFENAFSTSSWTAPGTASILTGLYPIQHGVVMGRNSTKKLFKNGHDIQLNIIPESVTTIGEVMKAGGFDTFAAVDNGNLREDSGFAQGFDYFANFRHQGAENLNSTVRNWYDKIRSSKRYFLYMQYMDPHHPYREHKPWFKGERLTGVERLLAAYKSEVSYLDTKIEEIYKELNWDKNTIILITSDHGEEFGEHGALGHGKNIHAESVRVPFIVIYPDGKFKKRIVSDYVSVVDILPTLAELSGAAYPEDIAGESLVLQLRGETKTKTTPISSHLRKIHKSGQTIEMKCYTNSENRLILSSKADGDQLYSMKTDKAEKNNLASTMTETVGNLKEALTTFESKLSVHDPAFIPVPLDEGEVDDEEE